MKQEGNIAVHGGIRGNNNRFNTKNVQIKNVTNNNGGNKGGGEEGLPILAGIFAVVIVTAYLYLRHFEQIFFWLKIGALTAGVVHMSTLIPQARDPDYHWLPTLLTVFGVALVGAQILLIFITEDALPSSVLIISNQPTVAKGLFPQAFEVWNRFNHTGQRLITENVMSVLLLAPALILNLLYGIQCLFDGLARSEDNSFCASVSEHLQSYKIWGSAMSSFFTFAGFLVISGALTPSA